MDEELDPVIDPILEKNTFSKGAQVIGGAVLSCDWLWFALLSCGSLC